MIRTKSVRSPIDKKKDGLRILATRYRGRFMPVDRYEVWMPSLAPSEQLLRTMQAGDISWGEFGRRYFSELFEEGRVEKENPAIKNHGQKFTLRLLKQLAKTHPVTLLCHCAEDQEHCHRHLLKKLIESTKV